MHGRSVARDRAWDGRFFMGVRSTGIYCLASCPARKPALERVRFYPTREDAEAEGFRPCLRCRPERFSPGADVELEELEHLMVRLRRDPASFEGVGGLAKALGLGSTRLRELCRKHFQVSPAQLLARTRVDFAAARIRSGRSPSEAGLEAGFESASAFHSQFRRQLGLGPGAYRDLGGGTALNLDLPADYRVADVLAFHGRDPLSHSERVDGQELSKGVVIGGQAGRIGFRFGTKQVEVSGLGLDPWGLHRVALRMLGLHLDPGPFEGRHPDLAGPRPGLRIPLTADVWEALVWAILGQQVNLPFAYALRRDLVAACGSPLEGGLRAHPTAVQVAALELGSLRALRLSQAKAETLLRVALAVSSGELELETLGAGAATRAEARLRALKGIGPWTARYVLMRGCGFPDCVPVGDAGLTLALQRHFGLDERPGPEATEARMAPFAPHRSLATFHLWASLKGVPA